MRNLIAFSLICAFVLFLPASPLFAGVEPSPFQPAINKLNSITYAMDSIDGRLSSKLSIPPNDIMPCPEGLIGLFSAMSNELGVLNNRLDRITSRLAIPPDDQRVLDALIGVRSGASSIVARAQAGFGIPPDDQRVLDSLYEVQMSAQGIVDSINGFLGLPDGPGLN